MLVGDKVLDLILWDNILSFYKYFQQIFILDPSISLCTDVISVLDDRFPCTYMCCAWIHYYSK